MATGRRYRASGATKRTSSHGIITLCLAGAFALVMTQAALADPGQLDTTFSSDGRIILRDAEAVEVRLQPDGKVLVVDANGEVRRYTGTGMLDRTFGGGDGKVETDVAAVAAETRADGSLLVMGPVADSVSFGLVRLTPGGDFDLSFSGDGRLVRTSGTAFEPSDVAMGPGGRIYVVGSAYSFDATPQRAVAVAAFAGDGRVLAEFGGDGFVRRTYNGTDAAAAAAVVQSDGRVVVAGWFHQEPRMVDGSDQAMGVMRLTTAGRFDRSFGTGGTRRVVFPDRSAGRVSGVVVHPVSGDVYLGGTQWSFDEQVGSFAVARLDREGTVEMRSDIEGVGQGESIALQGAKVWLVGTHEVVDPPVWQLTRFDASGAIDVRSVFEDFGESARYARSAVIHAGRLYVAGAASVPLGNTYSRGGVARFVIS
jgi:uncharacterized delta-60 repeat protein